MAKSKHVRIPGIANLLGSKNLATDLGILLVGFVIIGMASAAGTWIFKVIHNNYADSLDGLSDEKIPY